MLVFITLVAFWMAHGEATRHHAHMFQLNGYKPPVQLGWLRRNFRAGWAAYHWLPLLALPFALMGPRAGLVALMAAFLGQAYLDRPRPAKKPLVYTARVKRLLAADALVTVLLMATVTTWAPAWAVPLGLAAIFVAGPLWLLLANLLNAPLEAAINRHYINDAKRLLAQNPGLTVIGVTGSYGKTSVTHFLQKVLSAKYTVLATPGSYNTTLGVVRAIRENLRPTHQIFVCEMGARGRGQIAEICRLVRPRHGVITALGPQHLESFRTQENIAATKFELAESLPADGLAFLNYGCDLIRQRPYGRPKVTYGLAPAEADYAARDVAVSLAGSRFTVTLSDGRDYVLETKLIGRHNVENVMAAVAVADRLGVPPEDIAMAVRRLQPVPHRLQLLSRGGLTIIDDAYNANEAGAAAALGTLAMFDGFKILATPGFVELGEAEDEANFRLGAQAAGVCDFVILAGERQTRSLRRGLASQGYPEGQIAVAETLADVFAAAEGLEAGGRPKILLLENDLPDNY